MEKGDLVSYDILECSFPNLISLNIKNKGWLYKDFQKPKLNIKLLRI